MSEVLLFGLVAAIVVGTILYALVSEMRHSRARRSRFEVRAGRSRLRLRPTGRPFRPAGTP
ncbi:hypothetical protein [Pseudonocardia lacus]|uniref:hypothetical protein n=1 Tax=Pseudonocardia lacus TaxID=2835865 RepID=UPI001BDCEBA8|nr:hypothetical protein [Pseudonocardia lacus]